MPELPDGSFVEQVADQSGLFYVEAPGGSVSLISITPHVIEYVLADPDRCRKVLELIKAMREPGIDELGVVSDGT